MQLKALVDDTALHLGTEELDLGGVHRRQLAGISFLEGAVAERLARLEIGGTFGEYEFRVLKARYGLAEDVPGRYVVEGHTQRGGGRRLCTQRDAESLLGQVAGEVLERRALVA